ncbi:MAG: hypothetical protein GF401_09595 [Chitinivibrionales bacterium]|nr:hypothetical protein [Chitinivibrionales bacterium]
MFISMQNGKEDKIKRLRAKLDALERKHKKGEKQTQRRPAALDELYRAVGRHKKKSSPDFEPSDNVLSKPEPIVYHRKLPRAATKSSVRTKPAVAQAWKVCLEDAVEGVEMPVEGRGKAWLVSKMIDEVDQAEFVSRDFAHRLSEDNSFLAGKLQALFGGEKPAPDDFIFMDIETTGLSNSPLFLIGVMVWTRGGFEVQQFFARDYSEEVAVIHMFCEACRSKKILVTFNGKSFDLPYIRTRAAAMGVGFDLNPHHFDLLHESRRIWKYTLPDCKLQTLERHICNRRRFGDIPGSEIPDAYHQYVHTDNAWQVVEILKHNLLDLVTLADLMVRMPAND